VTFLASVFAAKSSNGGSAEPRHYWILSAMAMAIAMSMLFNSGFSAIAAAVGDFSTPAMLFVLTCLNVTSVDKFKSVIKLLLICLLLLSFESLASFYYGYKVDELSIRQLAKEDVVVPHDLSSIPADDDSGTLIWRIRSVGFLSDPNDFAQTIVTVLPWLLMFVKSEASFVGMLWRLGPWTMVLAQTLLLTHSRGGALGLLAMLAFWVKGRIGNLKTGALGVLFLLAYLAVGSGDGRGFSSKEQSANERIEAWSDGMLMMKSHPLFGVGYGNFTEHHIRTAHNSYVLCFSELGLVGYFFWLGMIVLAMKSLNHVIATLAPKSDLRRYANLLRASLVGFLVCAWFLSRAFIPTLFILLALAVSLLACARQSESISLNPALHQSVPWVRSTIWVTLISITAVSIFVRMSTA
jgi:putative inorganic carbon (HCO3(-)) transporter